MKLMMLSKKEILDKNEWLPTAGWTKEGIEKSMDEYAKEIAIGFIEYYEKFRREESRRVKRYTDEHGMISWVGKDVKDIYDDYINKTPIKSYILPIETFWQYDESGRLRHYNPQTNIYT